MNGISTAILAAMILFALASTGASQIRPDKAPYHTINDRFDATTTAGELDAMLSLYAAGRIWIATTNQRLRT